MAINAEQNQLDQANKQNEANSQSAPTTGGGSASTTTSGRVASFSSGAPQQGASGSGRFTNIQKYLGANQGSGEQLGSRITGTIDKKLDKTTKEADTQASSIGEAVNAEKNRLAEGTQFNEQIKQDPTQIVNDNQAKDRFGNLLNNQNVATNLQNQAQAATSAANSGFNQINQQVQNLGTEQGRFNLLQNTIKSPQYSTGQQRLDQLFLQAGNPNQLIQSQKDLSKNLVTARDQFGNAIQGVNTEIGNVGQQAADVSAMLSGTLGSESNALTQAQIQQAQAMNATNATANTALQVYLTNGYNSLTPEQKTVMDGILQQNNLQSGQRTYNVLNDPNSYAKYIQSGSVNNTAADVVDANELARYNALYNLAGGTGEKLYNAVGSGGSAAGLNGTQLATDMSAAQAAYNQGLNTNTVYGGNTLAQVQAALDSMGYGNDLSKDRLFKDAYIGQTVQGGSAQQAQRRALENALLSAVYGPNYVSTVQGSNMGGTQHFQNLVDALYGYKTSSGFNNTLGATGTTPGDKTFQVT